MQAAGGVGLRTAVNNGQALDEQHVAGIQPRIHLHDGHARFGITRFNGPVNRRRTAPAGEQGGMDIQAIHLIQHPLRQDQTVGRDDHHFGSRSLNRLFGSRSFFREFAVQTQAAGLGNRHVVRQRIGFNGRGLQLQATTGRPVRLSEHQHDLMPGRVQTLQRHAGKLRRARKNDPQARSSRWALSILVLMRLRLSGDRYSTNTLPIR